jgi:hypothetical protein
MPTNGNGTASPLEALVSNSRFIFRGTIARLRAGTMPAVPISDNTAIVRVDEVLQAPSMFADQNGRDITVQLADGSRRNREGQQAVFFTNGWLYGDSIAVVEVGRLPPKQGGARLRQQIADANRHIAEQALMDRIDPTALIVAGRVVESRPAPEQERRGPITEHDPDWWEAIIQVESVEKGSYPETFLPILFPNSTDEMWIDAPKFRQGDEGVWLLRQDQQEKGWPTTRRSGYTALNPRDFQPTHRLEQLRALINRNP